jgi:hypothetical protein
LKVELEWWIPANIVQLIAIPVPLKSVLKMEMSNALVAIKKRRLCSDKARLHIASIYNCPTKKRIIIFEF